MVLHLFVDMATLHTLHRPLGRSTSPQEGGRATNAQISTRLPTPTPEDETAEAKATAGGEGRVDGASLRYAMLWCPAVRREVRGEKLKLVDEVDFFLKLYLSFLLCQVLPSP